MPDPPLPPEDRPIPFGPVMATALAAGTATAAGLGPVGLLLVGVAVVTALALGAAGGLRVGRAADSVGLFSVPVALGALATATVLLPEAQAAAGLEAWASGAGAGLAVLALVATAGLAGILVGTHRHDGDHVGLEDLDGTWFLAPAAPLALSVALATLLEARAGIPGWVNPSQLAAAVAALAWAVGVVAYLVLLGAAVVALTRRGLGGRSWASWWVVAGCAGLAAAATGRLQVALDFGVVGAPHPDAVLQPVTVGLWGIGALAGLVALAISLATLAPRGNPLRRPPLPPPWAPTFSTGVLALGTAEAGRILGLGVVASLANGLELTTASLWLVTVGLAIIRRVQRSPRGAAARSTTVTTPGAGPNPLLTRSAGATPTARTAPAAGATPAVGAAPTAGTGTRDPRDAPSPVEATSPVDATRGERS